MLEALAIGKRYIWAFVEISFAGLLAVMLVYLVLGDNAGVFVKSVGANVVKFANDVPPGALVGIAAIGALFYWLSARRA